MKSRISKLALLAGLVLQLGLSACSSEKARAPGVTGPGHDDDDAGPAHDDADVPMPRPDAGQTDIYSGETFLCTFAADDEITGPAELRADVLGTAANAQGFGQVFQRSDGAVFLRAIDITGLPQAPSAVVAASTLVHSPALVASEAGFLLGYREERGPNQALVLRDLDDASTPQTVVTESLYAAAPATSTGSAEGQREAWALVGNEAGYVVAYREADDTQHVHVRGLDAQGQLTDASAALDLAATPATQLQLARFEQGGLLLTYAHEDGDAAALQRKVSGQRLQSTLEPVGAPQVLSQSPLSESPFIVAAREDSAGVIYPSRDGGIRHALKVRRISTDGAPEGPELNVADAPRVVRDGSIAAFGRGYVVVYRELPSPGQEDAIVRIAFINPFGSVVHDAKLSDTVNLPAHTSVAVQGPYLLASWMTPAPSGSATIQALRMHCPGALVLCGGQLE
jgi:hypothetical protein